MRIEVAIVDRLKFNVAKVVVGVLLMPDRVDMNRVLLFKLLFVLVPQLILAYFEVTCHTLLLGSVYYRIFADLPHIVIVVISHFFTYWDVLLILLFPH